jgi:hypothetical protein
MDALELLVVHLLAGRVEYANAPSDRFFSFELVGEHAKRPSLAGLVAADHVAFEEEPLVLRTSGGRQCDARKT